MPRTWRKPLFRDDLMYSAQHGLTGAALTVAGYAVAGWEGALVAVIPAALSHWPLDWFGERFYGSWPKVIAWEGVALASFAAAAWFSGIWAVLVLGWVAGCFFDLFDKGLYALHRLRGEDHADAVNHAYPFHDHNPARWPMTLAQTKILGALGAVLPWALVAAV